MGSVETNEVLTLLRSFREGVRSKARELLIVNCEGRDLRVCMSIPETEIIDSWDVDRRSLCEEWWEA